MNVELRFSFERRTKMIMTIYKFTITYTGEDSYEELVVAKDVNEARRKMTAELAKMARLGLGNGEQIGECEIIGSCIA